MAQADRLLTTAEVAVRLGLHIRKVQRLADSGDLPVAQRLPGTFGRYLFDAREVELWRYRQGEKAATA